MQVKKRDGRIEKFELGKIILAVEKAWKGYASKTNASYIAELVNAELLAMNVAELDVDLIHDEVEKALMRQSPSSAKAYILYRARHAALPTPNSKAIEDYIHVAKYSRFSKIFGRRETYLETVDRVRHMHVCKYEHLMKEIWAAFEDVEAKRCLPSMRSMQFAGAAIEQHNERMYNCSFTHIDRPEVFGQALYLLLCGCGVGYSVQKQHVEKLPVLKTVDIHNVFHWSVEDVIEGWGDALSALICSYAGEEYGTQYIEFDYSGIRDEGAPLKTSGGVAPGHLPMKKMLENVREVLNGAQRRKLKPIECHDIMCYVAQCVLAGGIRRSSLIALFSKSDKEMLYCKGDADFRHGGKNAQRALANNSVVLQRSTTTQDEFTQLMSLNNHGEPGFFFCEDENWGCNPCGEIMLYPLLGDETGFAFCNLTEVNAARCKTREEFLHACKSAAAIGTLQATYTSFPYLGKVSEEIAKRDALIGVSITGIQDNLECMKWMYEGKNAVANTNAKWAELLKINEAKRTTCIKPSGTASLELGCVASGIHYHHAPRYFRRILANPNEEIAQQFQAANPHMVEKILSGDWCLTFPVEAPRGVRTMKNYNSLDFLEQIFKVYDSWIDGHSISSTVVFVDRTWDAILFKVWKNRSRIAAMTFLPAASDKQIPYMPREAVETESDEVKFKHLVDNYTPVVYHGGKGTSFDAECEACSG